MKRTWNIFKIFLVLKKYEISGNLLCDINDDLWPPLLGLLAGLPCLFILFPACIAVIFNLFQWYPWANILGIDYEYYLTASTVLSASLVVSILVLVFIAVPFCNWILDNWEKATMRYDGQNQRENEKDKRGQNEKADGV